MNRIDMLRIAGKLNGVDITNVSRINRKDSNPRLTFAPKWLESMGFVAGALVQYFPEPGGSTFVLCDKNIPKYSELDSRTKEKGGTLMQVYKYRDGLQLCVTGSRLEGTGFTFGDALIIRYEYGLIRMRKLPHGTTKLTTAHVVGKWLAQSGFVPDAVLTVDSQQGLITCTLHENAVEQTVELVCHARKNKLKFLQVQKQKYKHGIIQWIDIPPQCLENAGFAQDDLLLAVYGYGKITLQKPNFNALGF